MGEWTTEERVGREVHGFVQHTEKIKGERDREITMSCNGQDGLLIMGAARS
jgi:hypothetical protein